MPKSKDVSLLLEILLSNIPVLLKIFSSVHFEFILQSSLLVRIFSGKKGLYFLITVAMEIL